jgi:hypothetical protein
MGGQRYSDDELIQSIKSLADDLGGTPSQDQYEQEGKASASTLAARFGSFNEAMEAAGLDTTAPGGGDKYTDIRLKQDIRRVADELGHPPSIAEYNRDGIATDDTLNRRFGSYSEAIREAGFEPIPNGGKEEQFTDNELIQDINRVAELVGRSPTHSEYDTYGEAHSSTLHKRFGGYKKAISAAGFEPIPNGGKEEQFTDSELIQQLRWVADQVEGPPTIDDFNELADVSASTIQNRFGSWREGQRTAGVGTYTQLTTYTDDELTQDIRRVANDLSGTPSQSEYNERGKASAQTLSRRFGSYNDAVEQAGLEPNRQWHADDELLQDIQRVAEIAGEPLSRDEYSKHGVVHATTIEYRFESWVEAVKSAGIEANAARPSWYSAEELIETVRQVAEELGRPPVASEFTELGIASHTTIAKRFGSYTDGVEQAGFDPHREKNIPTESLLRDVQRVTQQLNSSPTRTQYRQHGNYSLKTIQRRIGSFTEAVRAAGYEPYERNYEQNKIPAKNVLTDIRQSVGKRASTTEINRDCKYSQGPIERHFGGYWRAMVRAGVRPTSSVPLSNVDYKIFLRSVDEFNQITRLYGKLVAFTGLSNRHINSIDIEWVRHLDTDRRDTLIVVPSEHLTTETDWVITVPTQWTDPVTGETQPTSLNNLLRHYQRVGFEYEKRVDKTVRDYIDRIAEAAGIMRSVTRNDLRATALIHLAERGTPTWKIRHQIGDQQTRWGRSIEDYYLYLYQFRGYVHPDYEPSGVYLDPDSGELKRIESEAN